MHVAISQVFFIALFLGYSQTESKSHISSENLCSPLKPNTDKIGTLEKFRKSNTAPLYFWHLQKSAGSAFCYMMRQEYKMNKENITTESIDCNAHAFGIDIVKNFSTWMADYQPRGYLYVAMEPSNSDYITYPKKYHQDKVTQILLNESYGEYRELVWSSMVHVLVIRHPVDMALSAFNFKFPGTDESIVSRCKSFNISTNNCMKELFRIKDDTTIKTHKFFNAQQLNRIRNEILGDYVINTFSLGGSFKEAKDLLVRFSLIIDLSLKSITTTLMDCVLGWNSIKHPVLNNVNRKTPTTTLFDGLTTETIKTITKYLHKEIMLYGKSDVVLFVFWSNTHLSGSSMYVHF